MSHSAQNRTKRAAHSLRLHRKGWGNPGSISAGELSFNPDHDLADGSTIRDFACWGCAPSRALRGGATTNLTSSDSVKRQMADLHSDPGLAKGKYLLFAGRKHTPGHPFQTAPRSGGVQCPDLLFHHEGTESRRKTRTTRTNKRKVLPSSSVAPCLRVSVVENQTAPRPRTQRL